MCLCNRREISGKLKKHPFSLRNAPPFPTQCTPFAYAGTLKKAALGLPFSGIIFPNTINTINALALLEGKCLKKKKCSRL